MMFVPRNVKDEQAAFRLAYRYGFTISQLADRLLHRLCAGFPTEALADKACRAFQACERILEREAI